MAIHLPGTRREGALVPPIYLSTNFEHGPANEKINEFTYIRDSNPNDADLETRLAALDRGESALVFASGIAAGAALLQTLPAGAKVIFHKDLYSGIRQLVSGLFGRWNLVAEFVDLRDTTAFEKALSAEVELVWFETPSNPRLELVDIENITRAAVSVDARVVVDGTFATPSPTAATFFGCGRGASLCNQVSRRIQRRSRRSTGGEARPRSGRIAA